MSNTPLIEDDSNPARCADCLKSFYPQKSLPMSIQPHSANVNSRKNSPEKRIEHFSFISGNEDEDESKFEENDDKNNIENKENSKNN